MKTKLRGKDFISLKEYSKEELETILQLAFDLKVKLAGGELPALLKGKNLGMLFCAPSTRTRISFETGMSQLGGHAQYYQPEQLQLVRLKEPWVDTAQVMSRYLDGLVVRIVTIPGVQEFKYGDAHEIVQTIADNAQMPVILASSDKEHPCQVMADIMTIIEKFGHDYKRRKISLIWVCNKEPITPGIPHSLALAGGALGMRLTYAYPEGYGLDPEYMDAAKRLAEKSGGSLELVHSIDEAAKDAAVIYAKGWGLIGKTTQEDLKTRESLRHWRITQDHMKAAAKDAVFMNAMPLEREREIASEVVDGPQSVIYDEAENRLHVEKAILSLIMG
jgi:ornithine carbamoyltransferase